MCTSVGVDAREIKELSGTKGNNWQKRDGREDKSFLWNAVDIQPNKDGNHILGRWKLAEAVAIFSA